MARKGPRPAAERFRRLVVMVPWIMERGEVAVAEVAERFQLSESEVLADLERVAMCGVPPFGPDDLVDLFVDEGVVYAGMSRFFTSPLRLTAPEGFALLTAGRAALQLPGADPEGPLARALDCLERRLGDVDVDVALIRPPLTDAVAAAVETGRRLRIVYWSASTDEVTERVIDPQAVFTERGNWYVVADDVGSGAERTFRIDRIESCDETGEPSVRREVPTVGSEWFAGDGVRSARLRISAGSSWVLSRYPARSIVELPDGSAEMTVAVSNPRWLERLLVRVPDGVEVLEPADWRPLRESAARRVLARYRASS